MAKWEGLAVSSRTLDGCEKFGEKNIQTSQEAVDCLLVVCSQQKWFDLISDKSWSREKNSGSFTYKQNINLLTYTEGIPIRKYLSKQSLSRLLSIYV